MNIARLLFAKVRSTDSIFQDIIGHEELIDSSVCIWILKNLYLFFYQSFPHQVKRCFCNV